MLKSNVIAKVKDPMIENFLVRVGIAVKGYDGRLCFGTPAQGRLDFKDYREMPVPINIMGDTIRDHFDGLGQRLGVEFKPSEIYGDQHYSGKKIIHNPQSGAQYELDVDLWERNIAAKSSRNFVD